MQIKASQLRTGLEVDSFKGKINVNRYRYTLKYNSASKMYEVIKVIMYKSFNDYTELIYTNANAEQTLKQYNKVASEHDIIIND